MVTAVAPFSKGVTAAAARGWDPISANFLQPQWVTSHWPNYVEGCAQVGRGADPRNWRVAKSIFVADDAHRPALRHRARRPYHGITIEPVAQLNGRAGQPVQDRADLPDERSLTTTPGATRDLRHPGEVTEKILAFREQVGNFGTLLYAGHDWMDPRLARHSMELMATEVMPAVNHALGARAAIA